MIEGVGGGAAGGARRPGNVPGSGNDASADRANGNDGVSGPQRPAEADGIRHTVRMVKNLRDTRQERLHRVRQRLQDGRLEGREVLKKTAKKIVEQEL